MPSALSHRVSRLVDESHTLATFRDTLIPQLISGEPRVQQGEHLLEEST